MLLGKKVLKRKGQTDDFRIGEAEENEASFDFDRLPMDLLRKLIIIFSRENEGDEDTVTKSVFPSPLFMAIPSSPRITKGRQKHRCTHSHTETIPSSLVAQHLEEGHKKDTHLRDDTFDDFEDLEKIYRQNNAKGNNTVGVGDDEDDDDDDDTDSVEQALSLRRRNATEKLPIRKRAKIDTYNVEKISDEICAVTGTTNQIFKKEADEKEAEEKADNVWAAIKEIPDLEENECFDAMNLVHKFGMKAGFMSMTMEERFKWIKRSIPHYLCSQIQRPLKKPTIRLGNEYIQNGLTEDPEYFRSLYRHITRRHLTVEGDIDVK
ncbi:unnamed protein product [Eruca vesicaria subsp. sativa]|uniref:At2g29880-like C-terminal domain-containing protein n=1 Tax=Eruca vesicaria subsp. sativa TaxID=29727 RepID=A0ABC8LAV4_ERUVS|nr:unnamed protein product [Eruca vesicaria subsp. sativa]